MPETIVSLGAELEDLYSKHRRAANGQSLAHRALEQAIGDSASAYRHHADVLKGGSAEHSDLINSAAIVKGAEALKQSETEHVISAEAYYENNLHQAREHFRKNRTAYHEQALLGARAAGIEISQ